MTQNPGPHLAPPSRRLLILTAGKPSVHDLIRDLSRRSWRPAPRLTILAATGQESLGGHLSHAARLVEAAGFEVDEIAPLARSRLTPLVETAVADTFDDVFVWSDQAGRAELAGALELLSQPTADRRWRLPRLRRRAARRRRRAKL
jgi:hypothetical protein